MNSLPPKWAQRYNRLQLVRVCIFWIYILAYKRLLIKYMLLTSSCLQLSTPSGQHYSIECWEEGMRGEEGGKGGKKKELFFWWQLNAEKSWSTHCESLAQQNSEHTVRSPNIHAAFKTKPLSGCVYVCMKNKSEHNLYSNSAKENPNECVCVL